MLTPVTKTRRTDDIEIVQWAIADDGTELYNYLVDELDLNDWSVSLQSWRTVSASKLDGSESFSVDRGDYLAKDSDGRFFKIDEQTLKLLFN